MCAGPGGYRGEFMAWDPVAAQEDLVDQGEYAGLERRVGDGRRRRVLRHDGSLVQSRRRKNGKVLWQFQLDSGTIGQPVTYQGPDGKQYVAILTGVGGWPGAVANAQIDPRVRNAALGFVGATQDLPTYTQGGGELVVFSVPKQEAAGPSVPQHTP